MDNKLAIAVIFLICATLAFAGCTTPAASTTSPATGSGSAAATSSGAAPFVTQPTDALPSYNVVTVDVGEKDYLGKIPVIFQGGQGQNSVKKIDIKLTRTDGSTQTESITNIFKGAEVDLDGTRGTGSLKGQPDRVEIWATMNNGQTYKLSDVIREYRTRG
ncbi:hypothetical protein [uncultured Methanoregula sp.]|uniref:hypothetical protein n=1 Tax=uncultured Methanoregula sp. TaxID=1005933 RepID=UPI002AABDFEF|nr:hypothetical protein [uncultured Methanoregula sp.]